MSKPSAPENSAVRWVALLVAASFFMENLDATVITTALPQMAQSFGIAPARLSAGLSAYMLALAVFIPLSGWLADRFGPRRVFGAAILLFTLASLLCGLCTSLAQFVMARVLQGLGGAMMVPVGRLVVLRNTRPHELVRAIATITWPGLVAPVIGPPVGGLITTWLSWHWIFLLNVPLGLIALVFALKLVPPGGAGQRPFDLWGFISSGIGCSALMMGLDAASHQPLDIALTAGLLLLGVAALAVTAWHMLRASHPLVDLTALRIPTFAVTVVGGSLFRIAIGSAPFLLPLMFQLAFGWSAVTSGFLVLALFAGNLAMKPGTTWIMRRLGFRTVMVGNGLLVVVGFALCATFTPTSPLWLICLVLFFCGLCRSMQFTALNTIGFADVPQPRMTGAATLFSVLQQMNSGMGIALGAVALRLTQTWLGDTTPSVLAFRLSFALIAVVALLAVIDSVRLAPDAGAAVSGHGQQDAQ
ncbi:EmrB/QacA subfamily drug resistance transporter [Silvimonas terrae]|uniref:EmrB/QacA subfamily drug resistance transporter n=1 Tax=Silvimonas terrae TaxID=300266 RepID=A0A840RCC9_9NEIS|nr:MFS transporter [Silvimonas terrae]MBB5190188.1 EmrB/QacA subfamily drug resistance transporter [Silvimonas terrae]